LFPLVGRPALQDLLGVTDEALVATWMSRILACFLVGAAIGGVSLGWLGDKIGRVRGMVVCMLTYSVFTGLCYFATAPWQMGGCIFVAALGMGGEWSLAVALVMECWPERHRPKLAGVIGAASNVGFLLIAVVGLCFAVTISLGPGFPEFSEQVEDHRRVDAEGNGQLSCPRFQCPPKSSINGLRDSHGTCEILQSCGRKAQVFSGCSSQLEDPFHSSVKKKFFPQC